MLIITRKLGEGITIGDNVELIINEITDGKVKIAIEAPKEVKILRKELVEAVAMNREAAQSVMVDKMQVMKNLKCPVINVANKAIEETAGIILDLLKENGVAILKDYEV